MDLPSVLKYEVALYSDRPFLVWRFVFEEQDRCEEIMSESLRNHLTEEIFGEQMQSFIQALRRSGGLIAGSYPASFFADALHDDSDLDIFVPWPEKAIQ